MFGPGPRTIEKISQQDERRRVLWFTAFYVIATMLQCAVVLLEAVILGAISGIMYVVGAVALSFRYALAFDGVRAGVYVERNRDRGPHIVFSQWVLAVVGGAILILQALGHWPHLWEWRLFWNGGAHYMIVTQLFGGGWYVAPTWEIVLRFVAAGAVPFVLWSALHTFKWAAKLELVTPAYSGTTFERMDPSSVAGPEGQVYPPVARRQIEQAGEDAPNYGAEPLGR